MDEKKFYENLNKYIDGELDQQSVLEFERFMELSPIHKLEYEKEKKFDSLLRHHIIKEEAPYELREAVVENMAKQQRWSLFPLFMSVKPAWATLAVVSMIFIVSIGVIRHNINFPLYSASITNHMDYLKGSYPVEIVSSDVDEVMQWFKGKVDFAIQKPHISPDVRLIGGRIAHINDKKVAYFMYEKDGHAISAFSIDLSDVNLPKIKKSDTYDHPQVAITVKSEKGFQSMLCLHKINKTGCLFVSDLPKDQLMALLS